MQFIKRCMKRDGRQTDAGRKEEGEMRRVGATYIQGVSEAIKRVLQPLGIALCHKADPIQWLLCNKMEDEIPPKNGKGLCTKFPVITVS